MCKNSTSFIKTAMKFVFLSRYFFKYSPGEAHHISLTCLTVDFPCLEKIDSAKGEGK